MEHWWNDTDRGKRKCSGKQKSAPVTLCLPKNLTWISLWSNPDHRGETDTRQYYVRYIPISTRWLSRFRHYATSRKVRFPMVSLEFFIGRTMALGLTQSLTEMSARNISCGVKAAVPKVDKIWQPQPPGILRASPGLSRYCYTLTYLLSPCLTENTVCFDYKRKLGEKIAMYCKDHIEKKRSVFTAKPDGAWRTVTTGFQNVKLLPSSICLKWMKKHKNLTQNKQRSSFF